MISLRRLTESELSEGVGVLRKADESDLAGFGHPADRNSERFWLVSPGFLDNFDQAQLATCGVRDPAYANSRDCQSIVENW
jgi:hypothetical protein